MIGHNMSRKLPPLNALRAFEAAARLLSFTRAAQELCVTHGAVSQQIKGLEDYFGQPLFTRARGKVSLNAAGTELLPVVTQSLDRLEKVSSRLFQDPCMAVLTVNLTTTFASQWLIPRLPDFQQRYPDITVRLSPTPDFPKGLGAEVDVAIRWGAEAVAGVETEKLIDVDTFVACAPALLQGDNPLRGPDDLVNHSLIHDDDGQAWQALLSELKVDTLDQGKGLFYADAGLALQVAVEGRGPIVAGSLLAAKDLAAGRLVIPFDCFIAHRKDYNFYFSEHAKDEPKVMLFRTWIHEQAAIYRHEQVDYRGYVVAL